MSAVAYVSNQSANQGLDLTPEQEVRRSALVERLHKLGGMPTDRAELLLEALAALVEDRESDNTDSHAKKGPGGPKPVGHRRVEAGLRWPRLTPNTQVGGSVIFRVRIGSRRLELTSD